MDYKIELELGISLSFFPIYKLTEEEGRALKRVYLRKFNKKDILRPSQLLVGYLVLFILKKNSKLRLYINYR